MARIYIGLRGEGTDVWVPAQASHLEGSLYRIVMLDVNSEDIRLEFAVGGTVRCRPHTTPEGETILVAYEEIQAANDLKS